MKRFIAFNYDEWYPNGGMGDFSGHFDTLEEAKAHVIGEGLKHGCHFHIIDNSLELPPHADNVLSITVWSR